MEIKTDIEIAQAHEMKKITEVAANAGIDVEHLELYGKYKAKHYCHVADGNHLCFGVSLCTGRSLRRVVALVAHVERLCAWHNVAVSRSLRIFRHRHVAKTLLDVL